MMDKHIIERMSGKIRILSLGAMLAVVFQHCSSGVGRGVYRNLIVDGIADYAVSYFFIVSGFMLMKHFKWTLDWYETEIGKRLKTLALPYVIWCLIGFVVWTVLAGHSLSIGACFGLMRHLPVVPALWYVKVLFMFCVISPVLIFLIERLRRFRFLGYFPLLLVVVCNSFQLPGQKAYVMSMLYFAIGIWLASAGGRLMDMGYRERFWLLLLGMIGVVVLLAFRATTYGVSHPKFLRWWLTFFMVLVTWFGYDWTTFMANGRLSRFAGYLHTLSTGTFFLYCSHEIFTWILTPLLPSACSTIAKSYCLFFLTVMFACCLRWLLSRGKCRIIYSVFVGGR